MSVGDEWIKVNMVWSVHMMEYYPALKKEGNPVTCYNMDEPGGHYAN